MEIKKLYNKQPDTIKVVVVVVILIIILFLLKRVKSFIEKPVVNWSNVPNVGTTPDGTPVKWNPDPLAREISENLEGYNFNTYPETAQKILDLQTDDQVKLLYNHYNSKYAQDYPTLTQLFENEWDDWSGNYRKVVSRLRGLGLN